MDGDVVLRYSEAFKRQVIEECESGRWRTLEAAGAAYGVHGHGTIKGWAQRYGKNHLLRRLVRVQTPDEQTELEKLKARLRQVEAALVDAKVEQVLAKAYFEEFCAQQGITDVEALKKKLGMKRSSGR